MISSITLALRARHESPPRYQICLIHPFDPRGEKALGLGTGSEDVLLDQVGFYEVTGGGTTELVAVNFDPRESDLTPIEAGTLERWRGLGVRATDQTQRTATAASEPEPAAEPAPEPVVLSDAEVDGTVDEFIEAGEDRSWWALRKLCRAIEAASIAKNRRKG